MLQNFSSAPPPLFLCCRTSYSIIDGSITLSCTSVYNVTLSKLGPVAEIHPVAIKWYIKYPSICIQLLFSELFATLCLHVYIFNVLNCYAIKRLHTLYARYFSQTSHIWAPLLETCWFRDSCWTFEFGFVICFASSVTYDPLLWH